MEVAKAAVPTLAARVFASPTGAPLGPWIGPSPELRRRLRLQSLSVRRPVKSGRFDVAAAEGGGSAGGEQDPEGDEHGGR